MIHKIKGVYADGREVNKIVESEKLALELEYDIFNRSGRALFLDGICIHKGFLNVNAIDKIEKRLNESNR